MIHAPVQGQRQWLAELTLLLESRDNKTVLVTNSHKGPLRVQRPFYPERDSQGQARDCCHIYILHPPGGMVLGDRLQIRTAIAENASVLLTTPSAGKVYGVKHHQEQQQQIVELDVSQGACLEWLPQETIVFNNANARITTRLSLSKEAKACVWDIVCLGRPASQELFVSGCCHQNFEVQLDGKLVLLEHNRFQGDSPLLTKVWGLNDGNTSGTLCATVQPSREFVDNLIDTLNTLSANKNCQWGITQKKTLFIARYIGDSALICRKGFELIWKAVRPLLNGADAVVPRIWNT